MYYFKKKNYGVWLIVSYRFHSINSYIFISSDIFIEKKTFFVTILVIFIVLALHLSKKKKK